MKKLKKILNKILFKEELYQKLKVEKKFLILFLIFIGLVDVFFTLFSQGHWKNFIDGQSTEQYFNIALLIILVPISGMFDLALVIFPLGDGIRYIKKRIDGTEFNDRSNELKLSAIYVFAHIPIIPLQIFMTLISYRNESLIIAIIASIINLIVLLWVSGIITRGIKVIYNFDKDKKVPIFLIIYAWLYITGIIMGTLISRVMTMFLN